MKARELIRWLKDFKDMEVEAVLESPDNETGARLTIPIDNFMVLGIGGAHSRKGRCLIELVYESLVRVPGRYPKLLYPSRKKNLVEVIKPKRKKKIRSVNTSAGKFFKIK